MKRLLIAFLVSILAVSFLINCSETDYLKRPITGTRWKEVNKPFIIEFTNDENGYFTNDGSKYSFTYTFNSDANYGNINHGMYTFYINDSVTQMELYGYRRATLRIN